MATHSSILAWRIPWTEKSGGLQSTGSQRVGHNWATSLHFHYTIREGGCSLICSSFSLLEISQRRTSHGPKQCCPLQGIIWVKYTFFSFTHPNTSKLRFYFGQASRAFWNLGRSKPPSAWVIIQDVVSQWLLVYNWKGPITVSETTTVSTASTQICLPITIMGRKDS